jgi:hypothetical protein
MDDDALDPVPAHPWGFLSGDLFVRLPKQPLLLGGYGPPPFDVKMPSGETRHVIYDPTWHPGEPTAPTIAATVESLENPEPEPLPELPSLENGATVLSRIGFSQ